MTKYYAAVDEDGAKCAFRGEPQRTKGYWISKDSKWQVGVSGFPGFPKGLTWKDEPVEVELIASDELLGLRAERDKLLDFAKRMQIAVINCTESSDYFYDFVKERSNGIIDDINSKALQEK